ncbi:MAG: transglycosylase domain-containing protein [Woeseiaceae bacterium]|nr:transglycosylase domain-containing protein [Woeseiaceae bacterium]
MLPSATLSPTIRTVADSAARQQSHSSSPRIYLWPGRNFVRKGLEAWLTVFIEVCLPKKRILEISLNIIELAPAPMALRPHRNTSRQTPKTALSDAEAALLAAVLPNPKRLNAGRPSASLCTRTRELDTNADGTAAARAGCKTLEWRPTPTALTRYNAPRNLPRTGDSSDRH